MSPQTETVDLEITAARVRKFPVTMNGEQRAIQALWPIDGQAQGEDGRYLVYDVSHSKYQKAVTGDVYMITLEGIFEKRSHTLFGSEPTAGRGQRLFAEPVPRYSKKALEAAWDDTFGSTALTMTLESVLELANGEQAA